MREVSLNDFMDPDDNKRIQELPSRTVDGLYLQYYGEDTGILVMRTPTYGRALWSEEVSIKNKIE